MAGAPVSSARLGGWWPMVGVALLLSGSLAFLFVATRHQEDAGSIENLMLLRHLKQLDAQWESGVLKARVGIDPSYDGLAASLSELGALLVDFESAIPLQTRDRPADLAARVAALRDAIQHKAGFVEQFKSSNSVLRNSLAFLPTAADEVQQAAAQGCGMKIPARAACRPLAASVASLLLASVLYSQDSSADRGNSIRRELEAVLAGRHRLPAQVSATLTLFGAHVGAILREQAVVDELLRNIAAIPTAARIDEIGNLLFVEQQGALARDSRYRAQLLTLSAVLAAALLVAAFRLARSHAVVQRVNRELLEANDRLEQRVQERTEELRQTQGQLLTTARQAGMAEIASNVLHNVGNVLNSVNVSAALVVSGLRASKLQGLTRAAQLLDQHADDPARFLSQDARGKVLPKYLHQLAAVLVAEQEAMAAELQALTRSVDHIKDIVVTQQSHARGPGLVEYVQPAALIEDALRIDEGGLRAAQVVVERSFAPVPALPLDKGRMLQILVNLIGNARQAMAGVAVPQRRLALSLEPVDGGVLRIAVADQGQGIAPENLTRVFAHGFTTRAAGHGFGLHSAAIAAREMGGTLSVRSGGAGSGATFTLEVPLAADREQA